MDQLSGSSEQERHQEHQVEEERQEERDSNSGGGGDSDNDGYDDYDDNTDQNSVESPRPAKRRRPSPSYIKPTLKRSHRRRFQRPHDTRLMSSLKRDRSHPASAQAQPKWSPSLRYDNRRRSKRSRCPILVQGIGMAHARVP